jgi:hypothetical protein
MNWPITKRCPKNEHFYELINCATGILQTIDLESQIDKLDVDLSGVNILSDDTAEQLRDFRDSTQMDFDGFLNEVKQSMSLQHI